MKSLYLVSIFLCISALFSAAAEDYFDAKSDVFLVKNEPWKLNEEEKGQFFSVLGRSRKSPIAEGYHGGIDYFFRYQVSGGKLNKARTVHAKCRSDGALIGYDLSARDMKIITGLLKNIESRNTRKK